MVPLLRNLAPMRVLFDSAAHGALSRRTPPMLCAPTRRRGLAVHYKVVQLHQGCWIVPRNFAREQWQAVIGNLGWVYSGVV